MHYLSSSCCARNAQSRAHPISLLSSLPRCLVHYYFFFFLARCWFIVCGMPFFPVHLLFDAGDNMHSCAWMMTAAASESSADVFIVNCDVECRWIFWISSDCLWSQFCLVWSRRGKKTVNYTQSFIIVIWRGMQDTRVCRISRMITNHFVTQCIWLDTTESVCNE